MAFFEEVLVFGILAWALNESSKAKKEDRQRRGTPCYFNDGITQEEFETLAYRSGRRIKRIKEIYVNETVVCCTVDSQTGYTSWNFEIDFNDWGHITGKYWINSDNSDSKIPKHFGELMADGIQEHINAESNQQRSNESFGNYSYSQSYEETSRYSQKDCRYDKKSAKPSRKKSHTWIVCFSTIAIVSVLAIVGLTAAYQMWRISCEVTMDASSDSMIGLSYEEVADSLEGIGFKKVYTYAVEDLTIEDEYLTGTISEVVIDDEDDFRVGDVFDCYVKVEIYYHELETIRMPFSSKDAKGENYHTVVSQLEEAGFINVETEAVYDLTLGWLIEDEAVESISVEGDMDYSTSSKLRPDVSIVVSYHTFKRNDTTGT